MVNRFEVFEVLGSWQFRLISGNGKVLISSRIYASRKNAVLGIKNLQDCAIDAVILYTQK
jgi:uncharacterized protein YegP (UPF0339 family)